MKPPICKLCKKAHWTYEEHDTGDVPEYVKEMVAGAMGRTDIPEERTEIGEGEDRTETPTGDKRTVGRPKKWGSEAERLKAYRERSRG